MSDSTRDALVPAGTVEELRAKGRRVIRVREVPVLVLADGDAFRAIDNRCPHMGFPLHRGDLHDGLLDCHWHHARFDVTCGRTLDPWADDVDCYRVVVEDGRVLIDPERPPRDPRAHGLERLGRGLEDNLRLVSAKAVIELLDGGVEACVPVAAVARYGASERASGWGSGLSILACMANVLPALEEADRPRALVHAAARIASECNGQPPRRPLPGLDGSGRDRAGLRAWFRETVEVRDSDGAERVLATIVERDGPTAALDAVLAAATDHRYSDIGHTLDFAVKCAELAEHAGDDPGTARLLFTALVPQLTGMQRMEETSAWRRPVDVAAIVNDTWESVPAEPFDDPGGAATGPADDETLVELLLAEDPQATATDLVRRLADGTHPVILAEAVVGAATRRVLHFGTANEDRDWDTVHHTLTYTNAVAEGLRRAPSRELFRAVLDGAMSVYLDRFLNVPPAPLPADDGVGDPPDLADLLAVNDRRAAVDESAALAWAFLARGGSPEDLLRALGTTVLREDAGFHAFQQVDLAWQRLHRRGDGPAARHALVAAVRWCAAGFPTRRANEQTFGIARRLHRGEAIHEGE